MLAIGSTYVYSYPDIVIWAHLVQSVQLVGHVFRQDVRRWHSKILQASSVAPVSLPIGV
jgi:hypothetical protein